MNKFYFLSTAFSLLVVYFFVYIFIESVNGWIFEIVEESFYGRYNKKLKTALLYGFLLFLLSEAMLFGTFFWAYFDRMFHLSYVTGFLSVPTSVEVIRWFKEPLYATIVLIGSGWSANYSYYMFCCNDISSLKKAYLFSFITNLLGFVFLYIQYIEYNHLNFTISDTVYCTIFYVLTGFHGIHVIIGNLLLLFQYWLKFNYRDNKTFGLSFAVLYWHFVDIIWIFLFLFVYLFNNIDFLMVTDVSIFTNDITIYESYDSYDYKK